MCLVKNCTILIEHLRSQAGRQKTKISTNYTQNVMHAIRCPSIICATSFGMVPIMTNRDPYSTLGRQHGTNAQNALDWLVGFLCREGGPFAQARGPYGTPHRCSERSQ